MSPSLGPVSQFQLFARDLAPMNVANLEKLEAYANQLAVAHGKAQLLLNGWRSIVSRDEPKEPEKQAFSRDTLHDEPFTQWLKKPRPSVRTAILGVIYRHGPSSASEITAVLLANGYRFGKNPGGQVRSALWQARKQGIVSETGKGQKPDFRNADARVKWGAFAKLDRLESREGAMS